MITRDMLEDEDLQMSLSNRRTLIQLQEIFRGADSCISKELENTETYIKERFQFLKNRESTTYYG